MRHARLGFTLLWLSLPAADAAPVEAFFVELGVTGEDTRVAGLGVRWALPGAVEQWGEGWSLAAELSLARWHARGPAGRDGFMQLALLPLLRWRPNAGRSAWFVEGGVGLSLHDRRYTTRDIAMSTHVNFQETLALGRNFGAHGQQELSLRLSHMSNASVRKPNPGEEQLLLRYAVRY